jgi:hypothetical protein
MIPGIFASNQSIVGDRVGDFASAILLTAPTGSALLLALTSGMGKAGANDTVFTWFEDAHISGRQALSSGGTGNTIGVADGSAYVPGQVILIEDTGEYVFVTSVTGNTLTVQRGIGGTSVVSINNTMHCQLVGNAHEEGSGIPTAVTQQGHPRMNYTQIFRNAWGVTGTAKAVTFRTGSKVAKNKRDCAMYHAEDMERSMIWGVKHVGSLNGKPFRMTDGVKSQLNQFGAYQLAAATGSTAGNLSRVDLEDFLRNVFSKNVKGQPNERIAIGGNIVLQVFNQMAMLDGTLYIQQGETKLGLLVTTLTTPFGTIKLMTHPLMNENPIWQHEMYVLHPGAMRRRVLRETFEENYDTNGNRVQGVDADQGVITTEMGIELGAASTMGILTNVVKAVKSS